jgi:hypothetical protein
MSRILSETTLQELHQRIIAPLNLNKTNASFLRAETSVWLPFLLDAEWQILTELHNQSLQQDELTEFVERFTHTQPKPETVARYFDDCSVQRYRELWDPTRYEKRHWTRARVECTAQLILYRDRPDMQLKVKRAYDERQRARRRYYAERSRQDGSMQRAHQLNIWLPAQDDEWDEEFTRTAEYCRNELRKERCLLQHISRRRRTRKTELDRDRCLQAMRDYMAHRATENL